MKSGAFGFLLGAVCVTLINNFLAKKNLQVAEQTITPTEIIKEKVVEKCPPTPATVPLGPPQYAQDIPEIVKTNHEGEARISWGAVEHAKKYQINLISEDGKRIKSWKTSRQTLFLKGIPFDEENEFTPYKITIQTLNANDEIGPESPPRRLLSRRLQNIVAPTIKSISIED